MLGLRLKYQMDVGAKECKSQNRYVMRETRSTDERIEKITGL
jgi:hypothetical protein